MSGPVSATDGPRDGAQSVRRAIAVLRIVAGGQEGGVRLIDVSLATGLNRPTAHRLLRALVEEGAVEQDTATRRYRIGREVSLMGLARPAGFPVRAIAAPHLRHLGETLGETAFLTIRQGDDSVCLDRAIGSYPVKVLSIEVGARRLLGVGVSGVVLLAALGTAEAADILQRNAARLRALRLDAVGVLERCAQARTLGHAYAPVGVVRGTRAVAVPVRTPDGRTVAGIAVTAISSRLTEARLPQVVQAMHAQAQAIGREVQARGLGGGPQ
ncbi:IclR family transcriptional regulator [Acidovorax sp. NCPPB 4044]|uniref:IclR family transcriptional regulator n=1 Tax=Acidovorax sp. NCPPB 4044 TaxID=2940490 RepID=UPI0023049CE9|nr:IclR family transcriptional regulator [Acidovorax sp. NCPPB 4044]MDA8522625.1 IclR family transcriptional regulator [Acidovorax sp. NCPPB 4044]